jgi:broad specificity phosphatase PhoE
VGSNIFLLRNGNTAWCEAGRLLGRRGIGLSAQGREQALEAARALEGLELTELISSPLPSAVDTAEALARDGLSVCRDPRLHNVDLGRWEGASVDDVATSEEFCRLLAGDVDAFVDGENLQQVCQRMVASIEQAIDDNPSGSNIVMVSHAAPIRVALAHYLGMPLHFYHRYRLGPGAFCVLRRERALDTTRVLAVNWASPRDAVLASVRGVS